MDLAHPAVRPVGQGVRSSAAHRRLRPAFLVRDLSGHRSAAAVQRRAGDPRDHAMTRPRVLVIDNYDSFVYNIVQYLGQLGVECDVRRNNEISVAEVGKLRGAGVLLSPGPSTPARAGICLDLI